MSKGSDDNTSGLDDKGRHGDDDAADHDIGDDHGPDDPVTHDVGDDHGVDDPATHDIGDDHGVDDPATHDIGDDHGADDPATHDIGDDHGADDPATHDIGDDHGVDDPATHDIGDDHGVDDPATHDIGDDHGGDRLQLVFNELTGQWIFTDDSAEHERWLDDHGRHGGELRLSAPAADDSSVPVYRFHDPVSDVYFWTADKALMGDLVSTRPELEFDGAVFQAFGDDRAGARTAIGVVWDQGTGPYGNFIYLPADDAVTLAGQSSSDELVYLGVSFYL